MPEAGDRLYDDPALAEFYDLDNGWGPDLGFCLGLAAEGGTLLDLGCGTGRLVAAATAQGIAATGVDPAVAMLDLARRREGGAAARWVHGDARLVRLGQTFDLVVLTGHAFQVFLTPADRAAVCRTIAAHLAPGGRFVFDSRNPARAEWRDWTREASRRRLEHPVLGPVEAWNDVAHDPATGVVTYGTTYRTAAGRCLSARSRIAFPDREAIAAALAAAGLSATRWLGDWSGGAWHAEAGEIIVIGEAKRRAGNRAAPGAGAPARQAPGAPFALPSTGRRDAARRPRTTCRSRASRRGRHSGAQGISRRWGWSSACRHGAWRARPDRRAR